ncbi:MAG: fibronectin type III domain-containing protein, partial [Alphaproteobacteria bacterium]|nr:fibronectin type III domain-containing protein [Alphaproteobacteria bacterium]
MRQRSRAYCSQVTAADLAAITALNLSGQSLGTLSANAFEGLVNLETLDLSFNAITSLPVGVFSGLAKLKTLNLSINENLRNRGLPENIFADLAALQTLNLSATGLTAVPANMFADLANLQTLLFDTNKIASLDAEAFAGLGKLETLDLQRNTRLRALPENVFAGLGELKGLWFNGSGLTALPENVFSGLGKLEELHLHNNLIANLPVNVFSGLAKLQRLDLSSNNISDLPADVFASQGGLTWLNLAGINALTLRAAAFNGLSLDTLAIQGIRLPAAPGAFRLTPGKDKLRASWEAATPPAHYQLHWKPAAAAAFAPADRVTVAAPALTHDITGLDATSEYEVRITALPSRAEPDSAASMWSFSTARAATAVAPGAPVDLRVRYLNWKSMEVSWKTPAGDGGSPISGYRVRWKEVSAADFADEDAADVGASALKHDITGLADDTTYEVQVAAKNFAGISGYTSTQGTPQTGICDRSPQVHAIIATAVAKPCAQITPADLPAVTELRGFTSSGNWTLREGDLAGLVNLRTAEFARAKLAGLPANAFADLTKLETLDLSGNFLAAVPANVFAELAVLRTLNLQGNQIASLPVNAFAGLQKLGDLNLQGNPVANDAEDALPPGVFNGLIPGALRVNGMVMPAPPGAVRLTLRDRTLMAEWDAVSGAYYHVFWKPLAAPAFAPEDTAVVAAGAGYTITGLTNGTTYEVRVAAAVPDSAAFSGWSPWQHTVARGAPFPPPGAPRNLRASLVNSEELVVSWEAPASDGGTPVTDYLLRWKAAASSDAPRTVIVRAPALTHTLTELTDGAAYEMQIAARTIADTGAYTEKILGTPLTGVCDRTAAVRDEIVRQSRAA